MLVLQCQARRARSFLTLLQKCCQYQKPQQVGERIRGALCPQIVNVAQHKSNTKYLWLS